MNTVKFETQVDMQELKEYSKTVARIKKDLRTERDNNFLAITDALFAGKVVINVAETIRQGGYFEDGFPKIALGQATQKSLQCARRDESISFEGKGEPSRSIMWVAFGGAPGLFTVNDVPVLDQEVAQWAETLVPVVPPSIRPKDGLDDYTVLFEVNEWKPIPAVVDPILCKRLHGDFFTVEATWDMTELEAFVTGL